MAAKAVNVHTIERPTVETSIKLSGEGEHHSITT
jgi:hypothetical protein